MNTPEGPQEVQAPSPEMSKVEAGNNQQIEIEAQSATFSSASKTMSMELGSIIDENPDVDLSEEQAEMTALNAELVSLTVDAEVDDWSFPGSEKVDDKGESSETSKLQIRNKDLSGIHDLIEAGAITGEESTEPGRTSLKRDYTVDIEKAKDVLGKSDVKEAMEQTNEQEKTRLKDEAVKMYPDIVQTFKEAGVLTDDLEVQLDRLLKPDNIDIQDINFHHFYHMGDEFPMGAEDAPIIRIGTGQLKHYETKMTEFLNIAGVTLDSAQVEKIALQWGLSHEMGHAVERAMKLRQNEKRKEVVPAKDLMREEMKKNGEMNRDIEENIAPDEGLEKVRELQGGNQRLREGDTWTHERVAGGFEGVGLRAALTDAGLTDEQIGKVTDHIQGLNSEFLDEHIKTFEFLKESGIEDYDLKSALYEIRKSLNESGDSDVAAALPKLRMGSIGYTRPLSAEQTKAYIEKYSGYSS